MAAAVATWVLTSATAAMPLAPSAEPALKPNQPNHSRPAPSITSGRLCGRIGSLPKPIRLPRTRARARPAAPALMWTAVPPAKSMRPRSLAIQPPTSRPGRDAVEGEDPVRDREVDDRRPDAGEDHPGAELGPVGDRAADQRDGDDREHGLEADERPAAGCGASTGDAAERCRRTIRPFEAEELAGLPIRPPPDVVAEGERVAVEHPQDADERRARRSSSSSC